MSRQAHHSTPPKRVRYPTGCSFASGCSPPRLTATQLPSASKVVTSFGLDLHQPDNATSRTHSKTCLRHGQLDLFDERNLLSLTSADYPGEQLVACRNRALAQY